MVLPNKNDCPGWYSLSKIADVASKCKPLTVASVKPVNNFQQGGYATVKKGDNREKSIVRQSSLKCATDFVIANGGDEARVIELADMFTTWVLEDKKPTPAPQEMPF